MDVLTGILLMALGSAAAASFYVPIKKVKGWAWETYWITQGIASWIVAPWIFALLTVPMLFSILPAIPFPAMAGAFFFGALWGIGGLTFGLSMRYMGVALGQSIALGFCAAFGTLIPPFFGGAEFFSTSAGIMMLLGVALCMVGIAVIGYAGALKVKNMPAEKKKELLKDFALKKGLVIAVLSGVMSACMNFGINGLPGVMKAGDVIQQVAADMGTNPLFKTNPALIFVMTGGFVTNFIYCLFLWIKKGTFRDYSASKGKQFYANISLSFLGGTLWFLQFFFFGMGQAKLPVAIVAFGWSILMALNISFSNIWGMILREWKGSGTKNILVLILGIVILIFSTFVIKF